MPLCPARTRKGARQPVSMLTAAYAPKKHATACQKPTKPIWRHNRLSTRRVPPAPSTRPRLPPYATSAKAAAQQRSKLRLSAMRCADKRGRHSRHENKKRAENRDTYAVFAHKKTDRPKQSVFFALVTCSAPDGRLLPSLPQAACGVLPTFWV